MKLTAEYWNNRYTNGQTGWNIGYPSPPITTYVDQLTKKDIKILIPGCGNAYEAEYLFNRGFSNVYLLDFVESTLIEFSKRVPDFPKDHLICADFFKYQESFDLILEQTFFCALDPSKRSNYITKMKELLGNKGKLVGLLFNRIFESDGPPFGGKYDEYLEFFESHFHIKTLEPCHNSIPERLGNELFFIFENSN